MTQDVLNVSLAVGVAMEYYGFTQGPVTLVVTNQLTAKGPYRLSASYAYWYTGDSLRNPTQEELAQWWNVKA